MLRRTIFLLPPTRPLPFLPQSLKNSLNLQMPSMAQPTGTTFPKARNFVPSAWSGCSLGFPLNNTNLINFRHLLPPNSGRNEDLLKIPNWSSYWSVELSKHISFGKKNKPKKKRVPKLILIQNPFTWLMAKIDFRVLRSIWDPHFVEKDFKLGTKQAISRVTQVISEGKYDELNGLLTKPARLSLMRDLDRNWSQQRRAVLALNMDDIQISSPRKVHFIRIEDKKFCDVDMCFMALKWVPMQNKEALIFADIFARFHREYTPHSIPEWTIAFFKVKRLQLVRAKTV